LQVAAHGILQPAGHGPRVPAADRVAHQPDDRRRHKSDAAPTAARRTKRLIASQPRIGLQRLAELAQRLAQPPAIARDRDRAQPQQRRRGPVPTAHRSSAACRVVEHLVT
jgi:hypothetical protein